MRRLALALPLVGLAAATLLACGKKGPPLPPEPGSVPRIDTLEIRQVGVRGLASFTLPHRPGHGEVDYITRGVELWRRDAELGPDGQAHKADANLPLKDFTSGAVKVAEASGDGLFELLASPRPELSDPALATSVGTNHEYALILRTNHSKRGTLSNIVLTEALPAPLPPSELRLEATESGIIVDWDVPEVAARPVAESPAGTTETEGGEAEPAGAPKQTFLVHRALGTDPLLAPPLTAQPLQGPPFKDPQVAEGFEYVYAVRAIVDHDGQEAWSEASAPASLKYQDRFPPGIPTGLRIIREASGEVNLLWNPNTDEDLGGYGVYRRSAGSQGDWTRLDRGRVKVASMADGLPRDGKDYEYCVTALDRSQPINESECSATRATK